jgi:valyl-tRNA synthetase
LIKVNLRDGNVATQAISRQVMFYVLKEILLLLHPFIPFMTEAVYQELNLKTSIMEETFKSLNFSYETLYLEPLMAIIKTMREFRLTNQLKRDFPLEIKLTGLDSLTTLAVQKNFEKMNRFLNDFVNTKIVGVNEPQDINLTTLAVDNFFVEVTTTLIVDNEAELKKLTDQLNALEQELQRSHKILNNQNFLKKAAPEKVASEQAKMKNYQVQYDLIQQQIANLKK